MKLKRSYCLWRGLILGLSIIVYWIPEVTSTPFTKHFFAQPQMLSVNGPRPIADAIKILEPKYGAIITYEDAPYIHEMDVEDQTSPEWRQSHPSGPRALSPKGGSLEITYQISPGLTKLEEVRSTIQKLLDTHAEKNNPGRFRLQQEGEIFHIIPLQVRDEFGRMVKVNSILDSTISFPEQERTALTTLELIADNVNRARGTKLVVGTVPMNLLYRTSLRRGANNEKARDVLVNVLGETDSKLSWEIFYDPGVKWHALNVHVVR